MPPGVHNLSIQTDPGTRSVLQKIGKDKHQEEPRLRATLSGEV